MDPMGKNSLVGHILRQNNDHPMRTVTFQRDSANSYRSSS